MTSITTNFNGYVPTAGTAAPSASTGSTEASAEEGLFTTTEETTSSESLERQNKKQSLESELAGYQAQKQVLEEQLSSYTQYQDKLKAKKEQLVEREKQLEEEIENLEDDKKQTQIDAEKIKADYDKNNTDLLSLIQKMNDKIAQTTQQSAQAVQEQQKKTESATNEAFKKVENGEISEDEVMDYISQKAGNSSILKAMMQSGVSVVESLSTQIKGVITSMSASINLLNEKKIKIESLSTQIMSKEQEKDIVVGEIDLVSGEIEAVQSNIDQKQGEIAEVDVNIGNVQEAISSLEDTTVETSAVRDGNVPPEDRLEAIKNDFSTPNFGAFSVKLNNMENPPKQEIVTEKSNNNPFMSVTSTIDYSGFKSLLDTVMVQNSSSVNGLQQTVDQNCKLLDQKQKTAA